MKEEIRLRNSMFSPGDRVRSVWFSLEGSSINENIAIPPGTEGTIKMVDDAGTAHIKWDNGIHLGALIEDVIEPVGAAER